MNFPALVAVDLISNIVLIVVLVTAVVFLGDRHA